MAPADVASSRYELCYSTSVKGSACAAKKHCACESSPERVTLGQLRFDARTKRLSASYHLQCIPGETANNYLSFYRANHPDEDDDDAIEALLEVIKEEHRDDARICLVTVLLSSSGADGLTDEQIAWLDNLNDTSEPMKKRAAKKPTTMKATTTKKMKMPTKRKKAPVEKSASAAKKSAAPTKKKLTTKSAAEARKSQIIDEETDGADDDDEDIDASTRDDDDDDDDET